MGVADVIDVEEQGEPPTPSARKWKGRPQGDTEPPPPPRKPHVRPPRWSGRSGRSGRSRRRGGGRGGQCTSGWSSSGRGRGRRARSARRPPTATSRPVCPGLTRTGGTPSRASPNQLPSWWLLGGSEKWETLHAASQEIDFDDELRNAATGSFKGTGGNDRQSLFFLCADGKAQVLRAGLHA